MIVETNRVMSPIKDAQTVITESDTIPRGAPAQSLVSATFRRDSEDFATESIEIKVK